MLKIGPNSSSGVFVDEKRGIISMFGPITTEQAAAFRYAFTTIDKPKKTIIVEIDSEGGSIDSGFTIINTIKDAKAKVITRVVGIAYSMAAIILVVGDEVQAFPYSQIMLHEATDRISGTYKNIKSRLQSGEVIEDITWDLLDKKSKSEKGYWKSICGSEDFFITAAEAKKLNLIDKIVKHRR